MSTDKMREEFEAWARDSGEWDDEEDPFDWICFVKSDGIYYNSLLELACRAWQASRAAVVVELPKGDSLARRMYGPQASAANPLISRFDVIEAIEAAGLKVKA